MRDIRLFSIITHPLPPDRRIATPALGLSRTWSVASFAAISVAMTCAMALLFAQQRHPGMSLLGVSLVALALIVMLLVRSIYLTRSAIRSEGRVLINTTHELAALFESTRDSILVLDEKGICRHANPAALELLGVTSQQLPGRPIGGFCADSAKFLTALGQPSNSKAQRGQMEMIRSNGAALTVEYAISRSLHPDRNFVTFRDITERQKAEETRSRSLETARSAIREARALRRVTDALAKELRLNPILDRLLDTLQTLVPFDAAQIFLVEADAKLFLAREIRGGGPATQAAPENIILEVAAYPVLAAALRNVGGTLISDTSTSEAWRDLAPGVPARSWAGVPLRGANQVIGLLAVSHPLPARFLPEHLRTTESLAASAAVAIQNARLYERAEIYAVELEQRLSDLRTAEQALARSEKDREESLNCFRRVFRLTPVALSLTTLDDGRIVEVNEAFERQLGYSRAELLGKTFMDMGLWQSSAEWVRLTANICHGRPVHGALTRFRTQSGEHRCFLYSAEILRLDGRPCILMICDFPSPAYDPQGCN